MIKKTEEVYRSQCDWVVYLCPFRSLPVLSLSLALSLSLSLARSLALCVCDREMVIPAVASPTTFLHSNGVSARIRFIAHMVYRSTATTIGPAACL